ncbi:MAG: sigma-70 family RNA polymerase sigma factor [Candidatus Jorgensenbacteria bacterium]|nr:sigma-70 family RNA polymerase sigma factor [Candidatus Jorgensenbacteria bacterium]
MEDITHYTDAQVVKYVRTVDQEAYREVVSRYQEKLLRYAYYLTQQELESADIVQRSFINAFINLNSFNEKMKFSSWIYRIVHNEAINSLIKHKSETPIEDGMDFEGGESSEEIFSKKENLELVSSCLSRIPLIYAEPLSLFFLEEKSYEEISDILRIPASTVGTRISRAKVFMKKICQTKNK